MLDVILNIKLILRGPILTQSTAAGAYGIDSPVARKPDGKCYLPGTLVKGRLKQAWKELMSVPDSGFAPRIDEWMGKETASALTNNKDLPIAPSRGSLRFHDFIDETQRQSESLFRIRIDEKRGAVCKGAYQVIEAPYAAQEQYPFVGKIQYLAADNEEADAIKHCVRIGLCWITSLGAERSVGFGVLKGVEVVEESRQGLSFSAASSPTGATVLEFSLKPLAPFCIGRRQIDNNLFESEIVIPGGVLKGCLATSWLTRLGTKGDGGIGTDTDPARPELGRHFDALHITHAFPGSSSDWLRPTIAPLSLVKFQNDRLRDVALCKEAVLLGDPPEAPSFAIDWKRDGDVLKNFGWPSIKRELRVRTQIDLARRKAKDENLFAYEMVDPQDLVWFGRIDLQDIESNDRGKVEEQLRQILCGTIYGLGKTKCQAELNFLPEGTLRNKHDSRPTPRDDMWIVTLQTPALLCDPARLDETSGSKELTAAYSEAWGDMSEKSLTLDHFYARQSLAGGFYLHRRFQPGKPYNPYLLTESGSVFVLRAIEGQSGKAQEYIDAWLVRGLPLPGWAVERYKRDNRLGDHWANCPYLRANGYGEIAVNLDVHWDLLPQKGECHVV